MDTFVCRSRTVASIHISEDPCLGNVSYKIN